MLRVLLTRTHTAGAEEKPKSRQELGIRVKANSSSNNATQDYSILNTRLTSGRTSLTLNQAAEVGCAFPG